MYTFAISYCFRESIRLDLSPPSLPHLVSIQSARGVANLLEVVEGGQRDKLVQKHSALL